MPNNANSILYDRLLTNILIEKGFGEGTVGGILAPLVKTTSLTGTYYEIDRLASKVSVNIKRSPGEEVKAVTRRGKALKTYHVYDHALSSNIPIEIIQNSDQEGVFNERVTMASDLMKQIEAEHERQVHSAFWASSINDFETIYGASGVLDVATDLTAWDAAGASMKKDILTARLSMYRRSGYKPNTMVIPNDVFSVISTQDNEIKEALKYTSFGSVTEEVLARYFEIDRVIIPGFLEDASDFATTENKDLLYSGDHVGLFYVNDAPSKNKTTLASTFYLDEGYEGMKWMGVTREFSNKNKGEDVTVSAYWDLKTIDTSCGFILGNVLAG